jgi:hypothetical protein
MCLFYFPHSHTHVRAHTHTHIHLQDFVFQHLNIARHKQRTLSEVLSSSPTINISWRRDLISNKLTAQNSLYPRIANITLSQEQDEFHCNLHPTRQFSVKSHCLAMIHEDVTNLNTLLW